MANIPSPIVGAGGGAQRPAWYEQLLLTLAAQGPSALMQWMEHRQGAQQMQANDAAAQAALTGMAPTMGQNERAAASAAGGQPGMQPVGGTLMPNGKTTPVVRPEQAANQANFSGMQPGVAGPLLKMLQDMRTQQGAQAASASAVRQNDAQTLAIQGGERRAEAMQPLAMKREESAIAANNESVLASQDTRALNARQMTLAENKDKREAALQRYQTDLILAQVGNTNMDTARIATERNKQVEGMITDHRQEYQRVYTSLAQTMVGVSPQEIRTLANQLVYGTPVEPKPDEIRAHYGQVADTGRAPDLYNVVKDRVQARFNVSPEDYQKIMDHLAQDGNDPDKAIARAAKTGASQEELAKAAAIYAIEGYPIKQQAGKPSGRGGTGKLPGAISSGNPGVGGAITSAGLTMLNWGTLGLLGKLNDLPLPQERTNLADIKPR